MRCHPLALLSWSCAVAMVLACRGPENDSPTPNTVLSFEPTCGSVGETMAVTFDRLAFAGDRTTYCNGSDRFQVRFVPNIDVPVSSVVKIADGRCKVTAVVPPAAATGPIVVTRVRPGTGETDALVNPYTVYTVPCLPDAGADAGSGPTTLHTSQPVFEAAACGQLTKLYFDGPGETEGTDSNAVQPTYASRGVVFEPFLDSMQYPSILRNRGYQITETGHDGLLGNVKATAPVTEIDKRAIRAIFPTRVHSVGAFINVDDGGRISAFDADDKLVAEAPIASGGFGGVTSATPIARAVVTNTFGADITFGIYGFQFGPCAR